MSVQLKRFSYSVFFALCLLSQIVAQSTAKRPLTMQDFDSWRSLQGSTISRDGKFVAYVMQPQDGDGELFVKNSATGAEWKFQRGYRPPAPPPDPSDPAATAAFVAQGRLLRPTFSADSKYLFFNIEPTKAEILKARKDKKRPDDFPKNALGIMDLATGQVTKVENAKNYQVPEDGAGFVAILKEAGKADATAPTAPATAPRPPAKKKDYGTELILRNLSNGTDRTFADVLEYSFSKDAKSLVYAVSSKKEETNGAFAVTPQTDAAPVALLAGAGKYLKFTWDEKQTQLGFISDKDDVTATQPKFRVFHWNRTAPTATEVVSVKTAGFRPEYVVSEKGSLQFSYDGTRLFLSNAPPPDPEPDPNNAVPDEEKVAVDLWHWKDDYVQPMQKVRANFDRDRSFRAVYHIAEQKFVQLADTTMENINPSSNGLYALGTDDRAYRISSDYDRGFSDVYLVNTTDGSRKLLPERYKQVYWSKFGEDVYFPGDGAKKDDDGCYWLLGRIDDVLNPSGHRIGTAEVESALVSHPRVAEAAVVGRPHEIKGDAIAAFVVLRGGLPPGGVDSVLAEELREHVAREIGKIARPDDIHFCADVPKTRSGKIMRRLLRDIACGKTLGDTTTLADPAVVEELKRKYAASEDG